jgi:hypothetical protein
MPETDPFATANEAYSIAVAGAMNPAIHHPTWYKIIGALSESEVAEAMAQKAPPLPGPGQGYATITSAVTMFMPGFAQFTAGKVRITCVEQSWTIWTHDRALLSRCCEIASSVFEALEHTPVTAYGLNFIYHRQTAIGAVAVRLAEILDASQLGLQLKQVAGTRSAKVGYTFSEKGRALNVNVEQSTRGADTLFVSINAHHPIVAEEVGGGLFDLGALLRGSIRRDSSDAEETISKIMQLFTGNGRP